MSFLARTGFVHLVKTWLEGNSVFVNIGVLLRTSESAFTASERTGESATWPCGSSVDLTAVSLDQKCRVLSLTRSS